MDSVDVSKSTDCNFLMESIGGVSTGCCSFCCRSRRLNIEPVQSNSGQHDIHIQSWKICMGQLTLWDDLGGCFFVCSGIRPEATNRFCSISNISKDFFFAYATRYCRLWILQAFHDRCCFSRACSHNKDPSLTVNTQTLLETVTATYLAEESSASLSN